MEGTQLSVVETLEIYGVSLADIIFDSVVPACCSEGCEVEPDGVCEHGNQSVLLKLGVI